MIVNAILPVHIAHAHCVVSNMCANPQAKKKVSGGVFHHEDDLKLT